MNKSFGLTFYSKKAKKLENGSVPIYLRVTLDGQRMELSTKRSLHADQWNPVAQKMNGSTTEAKKFNQYLKTLEQRVYDVYRDMMEQRLTLDAATLKLHLTGQAVKENIRYLVPIFEEHNRQVKTLEGKEYAKGTVDRYTTSLKHTVAFLKFQYKASDIDITQINHEFITNYDFFLRSVKNCNNNSTVKYLKNFGKIVRICLANGWITVDPFLNYKSKVKKVDRVFLSKEEIESISAKEFENERLSQVRDIFLFSCFTGLAYVDVKKLDRKDIRNGIDGQRWIFIKRTKTGTPSSIPLLPMAVAISKRYDGHPECIESGKLLPVLSNQKMNAYLKEIADLCRVDKPLTFHIARHTFATTVTLVNGVPIESVSKMLGHTNIKTTQHYAKILNIKVSEDMQALRKKLTTKPKRAAEKLK